jgi:D-arabinose 1-dehydrogenase-like Zn-dependent alcohol dehydrogenase
VCVRSPILWLAVAGTMVIVSGAARADDIHAIADRVLACTVSVSCRIEGGSFSGSGFVVSPDGHVITTASAANHAYLKTLGPDQIIDYNSEDFTKVVSNIDAVFDTVGGDVANHAYDVLKAGGRAAFIASGANAPATSRTDVQGLRPKVGRDRAHLDRISSLIASGAVKLPEITVFALAEAAKANAVSKGRHFRGKLVLKVR